MTTIPTDETLETQFSDQDTRETVALMLEAGCTAPEIRAWFSLCHGRQAN